MVMMLRFCVIMLVCSSDLVDISKHGTWITGYNIFVSRIVNVIHGGREELNDFRMCLNVMKCVKICS